MNTGKTFRQKLEDAAWIVEPTRNRCSWVRHEYENNTKNPPSPHIDPVVQYEEVLALFRQKKHFGWLITVLMFICTITVCYIALMLGIQLVPKNDASSGLVMFLTCVAIFVTALHIKVKFFKFWNEYLELFIKNEWTTHEFPDDFEKFREIKIGYWYRHGPDVHRSYVPSHVRTECKKYLVNCAKKVKESEIEETTNHSNVELTSNNAKYQFNVYFQVFRRMHGIPRDLHEKYFYDIAVEEIRANAKKALEVTKPEGESVKV